MGGAIDISAEFKRLHKELERITQDKHQVEARLSKEDFQAKAPPSYYRRTPKPIERLGEPLYQNFDSF